MPEDLCASANRLGIPTVEVQHSMLGSWYERQMMSRPLDARPRYLLAWDEHYAQFVEALGMTGFAIGYPDPDHVIDTTPQHRCAHPQRILVTLQYGFERSIDPYGVLTEELAEALQMTCRAREGYKLTFRVHPVFEETRNLAGLTTYLRGRYPGSAISLPSSSTLLQDLRSTDTVLTHHSSTVYEAGLLGLPAVAVTPGLAMSKDGHEALQPVDGFVAGFHMDVPDQFLSNDILHELTPGDVADFLARRPQLPSRRVRPTLTHSPMQALQTIAKAWTGQDQHRDRAGYGNFGAHVREGAQ